MLLGILVAGGLHASPWLEADDPYLRSDLQYLADRGLLVMPTNAFPIRWSLLSKALAAVDVSQLTPAEALAFHHVQYRLDSDRLGRGRSHLRMSGATQADVGRQGFGWHPRTEYGIQASREWLMNNYAVRLAAGYQQANERDDRFDYQGTYLALGPGDVNLVLGWLERWWGPGWQTSLSLSEQAPPLPAVALNYLHPELPALGSVWLESLLAKQDNSAAEDQLWATRLVARPSSLLQLGLTYENWFGGGDGSQLSQFGDALTNDNQRGRWSWDVRLAHALPAQGSGGLYTQQAKTLAEGPDYQLWGADGQWLLAGIMVRAVVEYSQAHGSAADAAQTERLQHKAYAIADCPDGKRWHLGTYLQLPNDHQASLFWQTVHDSQTSEGNGWTAQYVLPALAGRLTVNLNAMDQPRNNDTDRLSAGLVYEYRFH
ncbi:capsule assembly Wzi family protein [Pseudaeromonas paramecii]|uniref:Capsule assembly Wzi family protein n=1 Tax=Pseudaeromonas paramecii TaxID=2138166 RepID=A0ABP8Q2I8_9GAMM